MTRWLLIKVARRYVRGTGIGLRAGDVVKLTISLDVV